MNTTQEPQPVYPVGTAGRQISWMQVGFGIGCGLWLLSIVPLLFAATALFMLLAWMGY